MLSSLGFPFRASPQGFKTHLLGKGFHTLINGVSFSSQPMWDITIHLPSGPNVLAGTRSFLQSMWDPHQIHPLRGPASLLAHRLASTPFRNSLLTGTSPVSDSNTICNGSDPPLADIVHFGLPLKTLKHVY